jgi:6-oxo-cyclohex-1-ene-carbonyl-CoA hydrolase
MLKSHTLIPEPDFRSIRYELRPARDAGGAAAEGLFNAWIVLDNPDQLNSYTTDAVKEVILAFRQASMDRRVASCVFTAVGDAAFCTGGNTREYAEYYAGNPQEYKQYMRLFNDMIDAILRCDKPVINRVNGMRIAGGQEIGMACDFTVASDMAVFGQAGPKHGSAPDGGSTDFLPLFVGAEQAMVSCTLCETWSAHKALRLGLLTEIVPTFLLDGTFVPNPMVVTDRMLDPFGRIVHGEFKSGSDRAAGKEALARGTVDLAPLDEAVEALATKLLLTMPGCTTKTVQSVRKHKLEHWDRNKESNRAWLALNMMTEAHAGFRAFNEGPRGRREVDFVALRQRLAAGEVWGPDLIESVLPRAEEVS